MLTGEQTTGLSNVVLASVAAVLAWCSRADEGRFLSAAFCAACVTASAGAVFHGFHDESPASLLSGLWKVVLVGLAATSALLVLSTLSRALVAASTQRLIVGGALVKLAVCLAWSAQSNTLTMTGIDLMLTLAVIVALEWRRTALEGRARWTIAGALATLVGLIVQASGFRQDLPFGHNDIFHLIQAAALVLFSAGLVRRSTRAPTAVG